MQFRLMSLRTVAAAFLATLAFAARLDAVWIETAQLTHSGGAAGDRFSWRVAIDGDVAVVTKPGGLFSNVGVASVFLRSGGVWTEAAELVPTFGASDGFGAYGLAISGDTIAVGTEFGFSGSVDWVFVRPFGGWAGTINESAILKNARAPIAFAGTNIVAGPLVFVRPGGGWSGTVSAAAALVPSDSPQGFGFSIAASGDTVVIGAPSTTVSGLTGAGKAYVFTKPGGGWSSFVVESAQLFPSNPAVFSTFGFAVAMEGKTAVVTSRVSNTGVQEGEGYVYVEPGGGWAGSLTENARLDPSNAAFNDAFGSSVAMSGDTVAIGDFSASGNNNGGAVYVFQRPAKGWSGVLTEDQELDGTNPLFLFSWSLAMSGKTLVVGAPGETVGGNTNQGEAHVYDFLQPFVTLTRFIVEGPIRVAPGVPVQFRVKVESPQNPPIAPTGPIFVSDGAGHSCRTDTSLSAEGVCVITFESPGTFVLHASYLGNAIFRASQSPALPVLVRAGR